MKRRIELALTEPGIVTLHVVRRDAQTRMEETLSACSAAEQTVVAQAMRVLQCRFGVGSDAAEMTDGEAPCPSPQ